MAKKSDDKNTLIRQDDGTITFGDGSPLIRSDNDGLAKQISDLTSLDCSVEPSLTQQHFADECDINQIMKKYELTGLLPETHLTPRYGDTTLLPDFQSAQNLIAQANQDFASLPAHLRKRFNNDPAEFVQYLSEPGHEAELRELGVLNALQATQEAPVVPEATTPAGNS
jgi:phage internal scaffolding protein